MSKDNKAKQDTRKETRKEKSLRNKENWQPNLRAKREKISQNINKKFPFVKKGLQSPPEDSNELKKLALELIEWASQEQCYTLEEFALSKGMSPYRFKKALEADQHGIVALEIADANVSMRLQKGALCKDASIQSHAALALLPKYDRDYKAWLMEKVSKNIEANKQATFNIIDCRGDHEHRDADSSK